MGLDVAIGARLGAFNLDVAFVAPPGITALFGPSGAGKTQTLRCIAGLVRPATGRVVLDGRALFDRAARIDVPARARRLGYLFQQYALFPHLDVADNIAFGLQRRSRAERIQRVAEMLDLVGLPGFERRRIQELSGGQQQRIALARALAPAPDLLLLDEPFSAVDALLRRQLRAQLLEVHERTGIPMLMVTHDLAEVRQLAGHLVLVVGGRALQEGPPLTVLAAPQSEQAAELLAAAGNTL